MNFFDGKVGNAFLHPSGCFQFIDKHLFNVRDDLVSEVLRLLRKCFLNEKATEDPSKNIIDVINAYSPTLRF